MKHRVEATRPWYYTCIINFFSQKIRLLYAATKNAKTILQLFKKNFDFIIFGKKKAAFLRANLKGYIKAISFSCFSLFIYTVSSLS